MIDKTLGLCLACFAVGAVGGVVLVRHGDKVKPHAAKLVAKSLKLKDKAMNYAAVAKEHAGDIVAEAKHLNTKKSTTAKSIKAKA